MKLKPSAAIALAVATLFALNACALATTTEPTRPSNGMPTTTEPTAGPSVTATTRLVISAITLDAFVGDTLVHSWAHQPHDPGSVVALTEIFGGAPAIETINESFEGGFVARTTATWTGFQIAWYPDGPFTETTVSTTVAKVGEVEISSFEGSTVGDDLQALAQEYPDFAFNEFGVLGITVGRSPSPNPDVPFPENWVAVEVSGTAPFDKVTRIIAPDRNYGI
ncbi:hypothetical protein GCM10007382_20630 [Salinibacterium xinjiangense]|uniref:Spondin domain-containing protein n=1 Tax=Salinibacterium xinjiangense TaxID=386302 RepID=A0A2C8ZY35_9MICO|nr:hypothetical protein [Salinibacterium xinjiangense]GGL00513.1 hypothetical protein GCM10007382_20630 [Salinibacterium xinjiangense]SOE70979.1 hypothetical protein SAMN06296378_2368 [Salinibacterium xinjiangense]